MKEDCTFNNNGSCMGQKNMPPCDKMCNSYSPQLTFDENAPFNLKIEIDWENLCKYVISEYGLDYKVVYKYVEDHISDFIKVQTNK